MTQISADIRQGLIPVEQNVTMRATMETKRDVRVLGGKNVRPKWERFNRLQKSVQALASGLREPKGVHCFKTWAEFNEWKMKYQVRGGSQRRTTS